MSFEEQFFGEGNRLRWETITSGQLPPDTQRRLGPFLDDYRKNLPYVILPRVEGDGRVLWYVLCTSARACRLARDEVRAFLGQSYSDFEGTPPALDQRDRIDAAVLANYGVNAFKVEIPDRTLLEPARQRLRLLMQLRQDRPLRASVVPRAVGRVLRDFEYSLAASDVGVARELIQELRRAGHLDAINLLLLEVRRLATGRAWAEIIDLPGLDALLRIRRPRRVTEAIISAVYNVYFAGFASGGDASAAVECFRSEVEPRFSVLYAAREGLRGAEVSVSFMISAVGSEPQRTTLARSILAETPDGSDERQFLSNLATLLIEEVSEERADLNRALAAFSEGDIDTAFEIGRLQAASFRRTALLLRCAVEIGTLQAAEVALESASLLTGDDRAQLANSVTLQATLARLREFLAAVHEQADTSPDVETIPSNWVAWLQRLNGHEPWNAVVAVAESGAREWSRDQLRKDAGQIQLCADLVLSEFHPWARTALRNSSPYLIESFLGEQPDPVFTPVYESLFLLLCLDSDVSVAQVGQIARIGVARLEIGLSVADYGTTVRQLADAFAAVGTPAVVGAALDTLESLIVNACPSLPERLGFCVRIGELIRKWYRRVDRADILLFNNLALDIGGPAIQIADTQNGDAMEGETTPWGRLSGKTIALYSLQENALRRSAEIVQALTGVCVETFHDHVGGSSALRSAAVTADIFVLATAAAKHAATTFIQSRRPKGSTTLFARGQGSASILESLRQFTLRPT